MFLNVKSFRDVFETKTRFHPIHFGWITFKFGWFKGWFFSTPKMAERFHISFHLGFWNLIGEPEEEGHSMWQTHGIDLLPRNPSKFLGRWFSVARWQKVSEKCALFFHKESTRVFAEVKRSHPIFQDPLIVGRSRKKTKTSRPFYRRSPEKWSQSYWDLHDFCFFRQFFFVGGKNLGDSEKNRGEKSVLRKGPSTINILPVPWICWFNSCFWLR